jgi:hypothetical protein
MWVAILEAYNKSIDAIFRILDWVKGRPKAKMEESRKVWEEASRVAQLKGDLNEMQRARAEIEEIDRRLASGDYK